MKNRNLLYSRPPNMKTMGIVRWSSIGHNLYNIIEHWKVKHYYNNILPWNCQNDRKAAQSSESECQEDERLSFPMTMVKHTFQYRHSIRRGTLALMFSLQNIFFQIIFYNSQLPLQNLSIYLLSRAAFKHKTIAEVVFKESIRLRTPFSFVTRIIKLVACWQEMCWI